jgi:hypothetical protein
MRPWTLLALAALASAAACGRGSPLGSGGPACPHDLALDRTASTSVVVSSIATVVRHDLDQAALSRLPGLESVGPGGKLQGLTMIHHQLNYKTGIALTRPPLLGGGPRCAWIDDLTVDLTPELGKIEVFVPSDYPEESCEYQQILQHELQHDETHRDALAQAADDMRRALAKADYLPARGTPLAVADRPEAERRIEAMVDKITKPVFDDFEKTLKDRQAVIDLPENYRWVARRCSNWK